MNIPTTFSLDGPLLTPFQLGEDISTSGMYLLTLSYVVGYIPVVGIISAIFHAILGADLLRKGGTCTKVCGGLYLVRAGFEAVGLGALLAPLDIGCTLARLLRNYLNKKKAAAVV